MKLIKPFQLSHSLSHRSFAGSYFEIHTILVGWDLITGDTRTEPDIWKAASPLIELQIPLEEYSPKTNPEFFAYGSFYAPGGEEVEAGYAEVSVGEASKRLNVFGERVWKNAFGPTTTFSNPEPFVSIPLIWQHAFGSPDYALNPLGYGATENEESGVHYLPRVELAADMVGSPNSRPSPGSFLPMSTQDPRRTKYVGTYGREWETKHYPGYPSDFDVNFFNRATEDQYFGPHLPDSVPFSIKNMHPTRREITGTSPDFRIRLFVDRLNEGAEEFSEIPMRLDTVWFFPEAELGVLAFHGSIKTDAHDRSGIRNIVVGYERTRDAQRGVDHYRNALEIRLKSQKKELDLLMKPVDLIPEGEKTLLALFKQPDEETLRGFAVDKAQEKVKKDVSRTLDELEKTLEKMKENVAKAPEDAKPELKRLFKEQQEMIDKHRHAIATGEYRDLPEKEAKLVELSKQLVPRSPDGSLDLEKFDITVADEIFELTAPDQGDEPPDAKAITRDIFASVKKDIVDLDEGSENQTKTDALEQLADLQDKFEEEFKKPIKVPYPRPPGVAGLDAVEQQLMSATEDALTTFDSTANDLQLSDEARKSESFPEVMNFVKESISKTELSQDDIKQFTDIKEQLSEVAEEGDKGWRVGYVRYAHTLLDHSPPRGIDGNLLINELRQLESSDPKNLVEQDFAGIAISRETIANNDFGRTFFEKSTWDHASVRSCDFQYAVIVHARLANCQFVDCNFDNATLGGSQLIDCVFENCSFSYSVLEALQASGCKFRNCKFFFGNQPELKLSSCVFEKCSIEGVNFFKGSFSAVDWVDTEFERVFFLEGGIKDSTFTGCDLLNTLFSTLTMTRCKFVGGSLSKVAFHDNITITQTEFSALKLFIVNFRGLQLKNSVFSGLTGSLADFSNASLENTAWIDIDIEGSRFHYANLKESVFENCRLMDAVMQDADLRDCRFSHCNLFSGDFLNARIGGAHFSECNLDRSLLEDWSP